MMTLNILALLDLENQEDRVKEVVVDDKSMEVDMFRGIGII